MPIMLKTSLADYEAIEEANRILNDKAIECVHVFPAWDKIDNARKYLNKEIAAILADPEAADGK